MRDIKLIFMGALLGIFIMTCVKLCNPQKPIKVPYKVETVKIIEQTKIKRDTALKYAYQYKTITQAIRIHDTLNQRFTDSFYCHNLEAENDTLWKVHEFDSAIIVNQESMIKDCTKAFNQKESELQKCQGKKKFNLKSTLIGLGLGVLTGILIK